MCTYYFAYQLNDRYPLILLGNRDEAYDRPSLGLHLWPGTGIFSGKDLKDGGMWAAIDRRGRIGVVTNYRDLNALDPSLASRGDLIPGYLSGMVSAETYRSYLDTTTKTYNLYNIVFGPYHDLHYHSNASENGGPLSPGIHGLSNRLLDTPWFKVERGKARLTELLSRDDSWSVSDLFDLLDDETKSRDKLPTGTGLTPDQEYQLSSTFITGTRYGTQYQTVFLVGSDGMVEIHEKRRTSQGWLEKSILYRLED